MRTRARRRASRSVTNSPVLSRPPPALVIDPAKMSWITRTDIDKAQRRTTFTVLPDYYSDRLDCSGTFTFAEAASGPDGTVITIVGDLRVHVFLVGRTVEQLIATGLRNYLEAEISTLPDFTAPA